MQDIIHFMQEFGYLGLFVVVFFESFPLTFLLPGDSLLFTLGFLASQGYFSMWLLVPTFFVAGVLGYIFSYKFGQKIIKRFFTNDKSKIFNPKYIVYTQKFFEKYGAKTIIIGRFVPVVRSFGPALAGVADVSYSKFFVFNVIGAAIWAVVMTNIGFYLGRVIPQASKYLTPIVIAIVIISILPTIYDYIKHRRSEASKQSIS